MIRGRFAWVDVKAGWRDHRVTPARRRTRRAPCGAWDYPRVGWMAREMVAGGR